MLGSQYHNNSLLCAVDISPGENSEEVLSHDYALWTISTYNRCYIVSFYHRAMLSRENMTNHVSGQAQYDRYVACDLAYGSVSLLFVDTLNGQESDVGREQDHGLTIQW